MRLVRYNPFVVVVQKPCDRIYQGHESLYEYGYWKNLALKKNKTNKLRYLQKLTIESDDGIYICKYEQYKRQRSIKIVPIYKETKKSNGKIKEQVLP